MAAEMRTTFSQAVRKDGASSVFPEGRALVNTISLTDGRMDKREFVLGQDEMVKVWEFTTGQQTFETITIEPVGTGTVDVSVLIDTPTSTTDLTPTGSNEAWMPWPGKCNLPCIINDDEVLALSGAGEGDRFGETGGFPSAWQGSGVTHRVYAVAVLNRNTSDVRVQACIVN